jgi:hypothetical protein
MLHLLPAFLCLAAAFLLLGLLIAIPVLLFRRPVPTVPAAPVPGAPPQTFRTRRYLFSRGEAAFYRALAAAVQNHFIIMAKVRLADVVSARSESAAAWRSAFNRIQAKHVDFVLLRPVDLTIALIIELDDKSHRLAHRISRDAFVDNCLSQAGLPILHIPCAASYNPQTLLQQITTLASA